MAPKSNRLVASALRVDEMPRDGKIELAFLGRSNAGKSSLLNRLAGVQVAHVSGKPGKTQRIHFYSMPNWYLVDLPGYGYAQVSKSLREEFGQAVEAYLTTRQPLIGGILIQDIRRGPQEEEFSLRDWAAARNLFFIVVASKLDRINKAEQRERIRVLEDAYGQKVYPISSRTGEGVDAIKTAIIGLGLTI
ncbi:MAG: ribosome biogenesis GTP-binding protein YsxC [Sulfobacillus thermosulfidooxidans]|nr:MAG: ribosome biogenesis GTP-binding protein YsxC [Sulfobacillus thermosulfidooxidans]